MNPADPSIFQTWRDRITSEFSIKDETTNTIRGDSLTSVRYFLDCIGWSGSDRRFLEAQPYLDPVSEVHALRSLLFHLDFQTTTSATTDIRLRNEFLPCFLLDSNNKLFVIRSVNANGQYLVFNPDTEELSEQPEEAIDGVLIFPEEKPENKLSAKTKKWTQLAASAFGKDLRMIFLVSFLTNTFMLAMPLYIMNVYDKAVGTKSTDILLWLSVGFLFVLATDQAFKAIKRHLQARLAARLDQQANTAIFRQLLFLPLRYIENSPIGTQITRVRQMSAFRDAFTGALITAVFDLPFLLLFLVAIGLVAGPLVWIPITLIVLYACLAAWAIPANRRATEKIGQARSAQQNLSIEMITHHAQIQNLGCKSVWLQRFREASAKVAITTLKIRQFNLFTETCAQALVTVSGIATLTIGTLMVVDGSLSQGALIACMALAWKVLNPIRSLFMTSMVFGQTLQSFTQIDRLMAIKTERSPEKVPAISHSFNGKIQFDRVAFRYGNKREPALRHVSFKIEPGEFVAICGPSGAGKSTIVKLLLGLYQQQAGSILIDGVNLKQIDLGNWRQSIGTALEVSDFYHGTVAQNMRLSCPEATDEEIAAIAFRFGLHEYFGTVLPEGLDTPMTSKNLAQWSDALKKRISLCRTFLKEGPIRILDNPADTLDDEGEAALKQELMNARGRSTVLMTTHRPSLMRMADKVLWIEDGVVLGFDKPEEIVPNFLASYNSNVFTKTA